MNKKILQNLKNLCYITFILFKNFNYLFWQKDSLKFMKKLCRDLEQFNITYIKIVQGIAANSLLFNDEQREYLLDYTQQIPYTAQEIDLETLNKLENEEIQFYNNKEPINSGIVAIVYKASYKGKDVAIKVLKNNIEEKLKSALSDLDFITYILEFIPFINRLGLYNLFNLNQQNILDQVYFDKEVETLLTWKKYADRIDNFTIPYCYNEFTENYTNVIVMEFLKSKSLLSLTKDEKDQYINTLMTIVFTNAFFHGIGHSDLHAGNVLFLEDNKLAYIDLGITYKIDKVTQNSIYNFYKESLINGNIKNCMEEIGNLLEPKEILNNLSNSHRNQLNLQLEDSIFNYFIKNPNFTNFLYYVTNTLHKYNLKLSKGFSEIIFSVSSGLHLSFALLDQSVDSFEKEYNRICNEVIKNLISEIDFSLD